MNMEVKKGIGIVVIPPANSVICIRDEGIRCTRVMKNLLRGARFVSGWDVEST